MRLERALGTPARIYYKYEGVSPVGSHKPNTAVAQAYYNAAEGITKLTTETGAGQWGASLSMACALLGLTCEVWQVRASYDSKPYRRMQMETYGSICHPSPSDLTNAGRAMLAADPETTGSLGMAISEAVEAAATDPDAHYALGSVLNHVLLHQTVIGQEALAQLDEIEESADVVFGCAGGGSNLGGLSFPFLGRNLREGTTTRVVACEPAACPSLTQGEYRYDFGDVAGLTPLLKMHTLGKDFVPPPIHAGGLRYHGMAPMVSHAVELGLIDAIAVDQETAFAAGIEFARAEGIIPAPESTHAVAGAIAHARAGDRGGDDRHRAVRATGCWTCPRTTTTSEHDRGPRPDGTRASVVCGQRVMTGALVLGLTFAVSLGTNVAVYVCRPDGTVPIAMPRTTLSRLTTVVPSRISIVPDGSRPLSVGDRGDRDRRDEQEARA